MLVRAAYQLQKCNWHVVLFKRWLTFGKHLVDQLADSTLPAFINQDTYAFRQNSRRFQAPCFRLKNDYVLPHFIHKAVSGEVHFLTTMLLPNAADSTYWIWRKPNWISDDILGVTYTSCCRNDGRTKHACKQHAKVENLHKHRVDFVLIKLTARQSDRYGMICVFSLFESRKWPHSLQVASSNS